MTSQMQVTRTPALRPLKTAEGVQTGLYETLTESVALVGGEPRSLPAGTVLTGVGSRGYQAAMRSDAERRSIWDDGAEVVYRA